MKFKDVSFSVKADGEGTFRGLAAVYGNTDLGGDVIEPGAFTRTIKNSGGQVPILWHHDTFRPIGLGQVEDSKKGLLVEGQLVMEAAQARETFALMKAEVVKGLSIGYDTVVTEFDKDSGIRRLKELKLWEVSPVTFPMNPKAQITGVKGVTDEINELLSNLFEEIKAGRRISRATRESLERSREALGSALEQIQSLLSEADSGDADSDPGKALDKLHAIDPDFVHSLVNHIQQEIN